MENADPIHHSKGRSSNGHISMSSDNESTTSQADSWHSPLRSDSPLHSDDAVFHPENENNCRALVLVDKYNSPVISPAKSNIPASSPTNGEKHVPENIDTPAKGTPAVVFGVNRLVKEGSSPPRVKKMGPAGGGLEEGHGGGRVDEVGGEKRSRAAVASILRRSERNVVANRAVLGFRVFEMVACLISFSVMAADKTQGWSGDSFDRYKEYRYCLAVNVIGFVYSGFQACDLSYNLGTGKHIISHHLRYHFDFSMDQIVAYILMSASSSAATRVDDWISNWGGDKFTLMASASIAMSFLAFIAFALSSLISGYNLCDGDST
ncbi:hypothetical protein BUALT_Bualt02G0142500 [Buddleja alternifolia]|uniref:CASP-like protein n=1 Tax=Buddleja alternifolia TaxID=168488 RepID=A0AAV6Y073_9LAMI|nr:hypothetical protein BUALT_Bualt02G0142500 [Buddleja alternifolia]